MTDKQCITKLYNSNYQVWKFKMEMYLTDKELWDVINTPKPIATVSPITATEAAAIATWEKKNSSARAKISLFVEDDQLIHIRNEGTAYEMWRALKKVHERTNLNSKLFLYRKLYQIRFDGSVSMQEHITSIMEIVDRIRGIGEDLKNINIVALVLCSLPAEYESLITALEARNEEDLTLEYVKGKLIDAYDRRRENDVSFDKNESALKVSELRTRKIEGKRETRVCYYCGMVGHIKRNCFKWKAEQYNQHRAKSAVSEDMVENEIYDIDNFCFKANDKPDSTGWFIDSGCTTHMTSKKGFFTFLDETKKEKVCIANGNYIEATGMGSGFLHCKTKTGMIRKIEVKNVLYVPDLEGSLLSVTSLANNGYDVLFTKGTCVIKKDKVTVAEAQQEMHLYKLTSGEMAKRATTQNHKDCIHIWHRRFGHRDPNTVKRICNESLVSGMEMSKCTVIVKCDCCIKSKMTRKPFPKVSTNRVSKPGELTHLDICGPMKTATVSGKRYVLAMIDDHTRYLTTYLLRSKDEVLVKVKEYIAHVKRTGYIPKVIQTDRGSEFVNRELK